MTSNVINIKIIEIVYIFFILNLKFSVHFILKSSSLFRLISVFEDLPDISGAQKPHMASGFCIG